MTKKRIITATFILLIFASHFSLHGREVTLDFTTEKLSKKIIQSVAERKRVRLGVATIQPTEKQYKEDNNFGKYFIEKLVTVLKKQKSKIRLFERNRLEEILREYSLNQSGLISEKEAIEIGGIAPIDYLITGTYTRLKRKVDINIRMLDVVSGEIAATFSAGVGLDEDLLSLFPENSDKDSKGKKGSFCEKKWKNINRAMADLRNEKSIGSLVEMGKAFPLASRCGSIHLKIIYTFTANRINNNAYSSYLTGQLASLKVSDYKKAEAVIEYLRRDRIITRGEWRAGFNYLKRCDRSGIYSLLRLLLFRDIKSANVERIQKKYINEFFREVKRKKVGLPRSIDFDSAYRIIMESQGAHTGRAHSGIFIYCHNRYHKRVSSKNRIKVYRYLQRMYTHEKVKSKKDEMLKMIALFFNEEKPGSKTARQIYNFTVSLEKMMEKKNDRRKGLYRSHINTLLKLCRRQIMKSFAEIPNTRKNKKYILFCVKYNLRVPGLAPPVNELEKQLFSERINDRIKAAKYFAEMGVYAAKSEGKILKILVRSKSMRQRGTGNLQFNLIKALGNIRSSDPKVHKELIYFLNNSVSQTATNAEEALVKIGKPVIPLLKKEFPRQNHRVKNRIISVFFQLKPAMKTEVAFLKRMKKNEKKKFLKQRLDDLIEQLI
jgi:hypothetical protein